MRSTALITLFATAVAFRSPRVGLSPRARIGRLAASAADGEKPPALVPLAYQASGVAVAAAWVKCVHTAISSTSVYLVPGMHGSVGCHGQLAMAGCMAPIPLLAACVSVLASSSKSAWPSTPTERRLSVGLVAAALGSALCVGYADVLTAVPGAKVFHVAYEGRTRAALLAAYGSAAALGGAAWARGLPAAARASPRAWLARVGDGVAGSLARLSPASSSDDPDAAACTSGAVKYSLLTQSFLVLTFLQLLPFPLATVPSFTGRRLSRGFAPWTLLGAVVSYALKDAAEKGDLATDAARTLSKGLAGFGAIFLAANVGKLVFDAGVYGLATYPAVTGMAAWSMTSMVMMGLTLRRDP